MSWFKQQTSSGAAFEITIGGKTYRQADSEQGGVQQVVVEDHVDMLDTLSLRMGGTAGQPKWEWKIGDEVEAKIGQGNVTLFKGQITSMEPSYQVSGITQITLRALDQMHKLGRGRKTEFFEDMTDAEVVEKVAGKAGLSIGDIQATDEVHPYILQRNESDVAFLKRLAARNNYLLRMEDGGLSFKKAEFGGGGYDLKMGDTQQSMRNFRLNYNSTDMVQKVVVRGWDISKKEPIVGEATADQVEKIGSGEVGASMAGQFGDSVAYITDVPVSSQAQAEAIARHEMNRIARQFARGSATIQGQDKVRAGTMLNVSGLQQGMNGSFYILASRHIVSNRTGYSTEVSFCSNCMGT